MKMVERIKKLWVKALRSGDYIQGIGKLLGGTYNNPEHCCLAVLCDLHAKETDTIWNGDQYLCESYVLCSEVIEWAGLTEYQGDEVTIDDRRCTLTNHNDAGRTYEQIATAIEEQL